MQAHQLNVIIRVRFLLLQIPQHLLEADKLSDEYISLIDLIGYNDQLFLGSKLDDFFNNINRQRCTRWIARVDHANTSNIGSFSFSCVDGIIQRRHVSAPLRLFLEIVFDRSSVEEGEGG